VSAEPPAGTGWSYRNPVELVGGIGSADQVGPATHADRHRGPVVVVAGAGAEGRGDLEPVLAGFGPGVAIERVSSSANPTLDGIDAELERLSGVQPACVVAVGGGSAMDTGKVLALGLGTPGFRAREHFRSAAAIPERRVRLVCVPTTAGTGSEVTPFATVWDGPKKLSMSGEPMFADVAVLDPSLTQGLPRAVTISTGLDALTQALEATWSRRATPVTDAFAIRAVAIGIDALGAVVGQPSDIALRSSMLDTSVLAGLAISHTRTALCHSISYPLTGTFGVPHGLACAFTLCDVFRFNQVAVPERFAAIARAVGTRDAADLLDRLEQLLVQVDLPSLLAPHLGDDDPVGLVDQMLTPGRADNNVRSATVDDVKKIVASANARWRRADTGR
jgi:alcohol dehydrogenase